LVSTPAAPTLVQRLVAALAAAKSWAEGPGGRQVKKWGSLALSVLILGLLIDAIAQVGWAETVAALPASPLFWLVFLAAYLWQPVNDFLIYRRWWPMGLDGFGVMLKMRVMNEALFSYSGTTYLLVWATGRLGISFDPAAPPPKLLGRGGGPGVDPRTSPFAAVKDNAITSGMAGVLSTILFLILALALGADDVIYGTLDGGVVRTMILAFGAMILLNLSILAFRSRIMSMPARENLRCFFMHFARVTGTQLLFIASWIIALPAIGVVTWVLLGALRMVITRMPIPNQQVLFAAIAVSLTGDASVQVAALMAAQGALHLVFHGLAWLAAGALAGRPPAALAEKA
jgi:hypothetical protein